MATSALLADPIGSDTHLRPDSPHFPSAQLHSPPRRSSSAGGGGACLLPYINASRSGAVVQGIEGGKTSSSPVNDFLPSELVLSLRQRGGFPEDPPKGGARLPSARGPQQKEMVLGGLPRPPANVWSYPGRRGRLRHLTDHPPCVCGAGRDISFLYDTFGTDGGRKREEEETSSVPPNTLIPYEYHIVKHPGVIGLEFHNDPYTTRAEGHDHHMTVFPSMKPAGRHEAVMLKHTMDKMLQQAGVPHEMKDEELKGLTELHNLLELVKVEQNIYNVCFHELIRQVSVHCVERGELLGDIRRRYNNLLNRVPQQVKSLHDELVAQRALDRRLTGELRRFRGRLKSLTDELSGVKDHDLEITEQSRTAQDSLATALADSEKNANLLAEYHDLYELQRKRLEDQVADLTAERSLWQQAAYDLATKVAEEGNLKTVRRLQLSEKSWAKLAGHFAILLSDRDTQQLLEIQEYTQKWREQVVGVVGRLKQVEGRMKERLLVIEEALKRWNGELGSTAGLGGSAHQPDRSQLDRLWTEMQVWMSVLNEESEHFTGEVLLTRQEEIAGLNNLVEQWTEVSVQLFARHQRADDAPHSHEQEMMLQLNKAVDSSLAHWGTRLSGENGVATGFIRLVTPLEAWDTKLSLLLSSADKKFPDSEWMKLQTLLREWLEQIHSIRGYIGHTQTNTSQEEGPSLEELVVRVEKWRSAFSYAIDSHDTKTMDNVSQLHSSLVKWMVELLLALAGTQVQLVEGGEELQQKGAVSLPELQAERTTLADALAKFTKLLSRSCTDVVREIVDHRRTEGYADAEEEQNELKRLTEEAGEWMKLAELLLEEVKQKREREDETKERKKSTEGSSAGEPTDGENELTELPEEMNVVGIDDNIHAKSLQIAICETKVSPAASATELGLATEEDIPEGRGAVRKDAEALVIALDDTQQKLKEQEERTREEEERAIKAEKELEDTRQQLAQLQSEVEQLRTSLEQAKEQSGRTSRVSTRGGRKVSRVDRRK